MRTFEVDRNNNFVFGGNGQIGIVGGVQAISQTAEQYVKARRAEMMFKLDEGVPFDLIAWAADPNEATFEVSVSGRLLQVEGVTAVSAFEIVRAGEVLKYTATLVTTEGELSVNG